MTTRFKLLLWASQKIKGNLSYFQNPLFLFLHCHIATPFNNGFPSSFLSCSSQMLPFMFSFFFSVETSQSSISRLGFEWPFHIGWVVPNESISRIELKIVTMLDTKPANKEEPLTWLFLKRFPRNRDHQHIVTKWRADVHTAASLWTNIAVKKIDFFFTRIFALSDLQKVNLIWK